MLHIEKRKIRSKRNSRETTAPILGEHPLPRVDVPTRRLHAARRVTLPKVSEQRRALSGGSGEYMWLTGLRDTWRIVYPDLHARATPYVREVLCALFARVKKVFELAKNETLQHSCLCQTRQLRDNGHSRGVSREERPRCVDLLVEGNTDALIPLDLWRSSGAEHGYND